MVLFARSDQLEVKCEARPGTSHVRPRLTRDPDSDFVPTWGVDCPPCERGHLKNDPHWARTRHRIPLTPDEKDEAEQAIRDAAAMDAQIKLMEARQRSAHYKELLATGELDAGADEPVITGAEDTVASAPVVTETLQADPGASYRGLPVKDLRDLARDRGIPVSGSKQELIDRHIAYDA